MSNPVASAHELVQCNGCDQTDDHPKVRVRFHSWQKDAKTMIIDPDFHFDCLPDEYRSMLKNEDGQYELQHATTVAAIEAAESGVHGEDLREHIASLPSDNEIGHGLPDGHADGDPNAETVEA